MEVNRVKKKLFVSKDEISINCQFLVFLAEIGQKIITIKTVLLGLITKLFSPLQILFYLLICFFFVFVNEFKSFTATLAPFFSKHIFFCNCFPRNNVLLRSLGQTQLVSMQAGFEV